MDCLLNTRNGAETLLEYCAGTLGATQVAEFEAHLTECAECRRVVEAQRSVWIALDHYAVPEVSSNFDQRLYAGIARLDAAPWWRKAWQSMFDPALPWAAWKPAVSLAAACAVLAVGFLVRLPEPSDPGKQARVEAVDIEQVEQALEDLDMLTPAAPSPASAM
jgi:anti-sigma-K factor RskA